MPQPEPNQGASFFGAPAHPRDWATLLPPTVRSPQAARRFTSEVVDGWELPEFRDNVVLVVDELVTNAVRHATSGAIMVALSAVGKTVRVEVTDDSDTAPSELPPSDTRPGGRGLWIVAALCEAWGVHKESKRWEDRVGKPRRAPPVQQLAGG